MTAEQAAVLQVELARWQLYLSGAQAAIGLVGLIFLAAYVVKTAQIADETKRAALATEQAAKATEIEAQGTRAAAETAIAQLTEMQQAREGAALAATNELAELASARLAAIRPYVRVNNVVAIVEDASAGGKNHVVDLEIANWGPGPALSVHGEIKGGWLTFDSPRNKVSMQGHERHESLRLGRIELLRAPDGRDGQSDCVLLLEYMDLNNQLWTTEVTLRGARPNYPNLSLEVREQTYNIGQIPRFTIPLDTLGTAEDTGL